MNRTQLKLLAIAAMFNDHFAWAFVPPGTPLAQGMHTIGCPPCGRRIDAC